MDASLDNANNPFTISNGATTDNIISQKSDGLLLNLTDNFKHNGTDISPSADFYGKEKSNGKRTASEFEDDDDFGPETDVDVVDDALSPAEKTKGFGDVFGNNNPAEGVYNPFMEHQEKAALEIERELQKQESGEFEEQRLAREETPTPPADAVHDVSGLVDNTADSESEDEWNYFKGDEANKENISPQPDREVAEVPEEDDNMSQLNPNAAEFVPVSPTRSIPSPACRTLLNDQVISQSPRRPANDIDINVPNPVEFEKEVKSRPSEVDSYSNGQSDSDHNITPTDLMENLLNGKNIDEIPEFQPGSTPRKTASNEEFHFGPNAAPFTPAKFLDQSEAALSTRAVFGDESTATLGTSFNESVSSQDINLGKESDPMSMSFYADKGDTNPFDLNEVHILPDNIDEFLKRPDNSLFNDTISDLPEHHPLGDGENLTLNNDDAIQTTDLDKRSYDDEKELASPFEPDREWPESEKDILGGGGECDLSKTPEPTHENLLGREFCQILSKSKTPELEPLPRDVELISPEPTSRRSESASPRPALYHEEISEAAKSPLPEATEVSDLLRTDSDSLPQDVELISPQLTSTSPSLTHGEITQSPPPPSVEHKEVDLLQAEAQAVQSKSPLPEPSASTGIDAESDASDHKSPLPEVLESNTHLLQMIENHIENVLPQSPLPEVLESNTHLLQMIEHHIENLSPQPPLPEVLESNTHLLQMAENHIENLSSQSPLPEVCHLPQSRTPTSDIFETKSPGGGRSGSDSPVCGLPVCERGDFESPVCEIPVLRSPVNGPGGARSPVIDIVVETILPDQSESQLPILECTKDVASAVYEDIAVSPVPPQEDASDFTKPENITEAQLHFEEIYKSEENIGKPEEDFIKEEAIEQAQKYFEEHWQPKEQNISLLASLQDDVTSTLRDELSCSARPPLPEQALEESHTADQSTLISDIAQDIAGVIQETIVNAVSSPLPNETVVPTSCLISPPRSVVDTESVATTDVNSFLDRSLPPDVASPLSPTEQELDDMKKCVYQIDDQLASEQAAPYTLDLNHPLSRCVYPLPSQEAGEHIEIKTEHIAPEYAEQAIVTPSDESKQEDVPTAPPIEEPLREPLVEKLEIQKEGAPPLEVIAGAGGGATKVEREEKKKSGAAPAKKPSAARSTTTTSKTSTRAPLAAPKAASRLSVSPKPAPMKTGVAKTSTLSASKQTAAKTSPRPRPATAPKSTEKKPLANGDIRSSVRSTLTSRRITESTAAKSATPRPAAAGAATKLSPIKSATPRPTAPRPATAPRVTASRTVTTTTNALPKARPTTLTANKPSSGTAARSTATKSPPPPKTSPKTSSATRSKPPMVALSKPRVPLTKTITKAPDTEKQNKESANKLTASRTLTGSTRTASTTARTTSTTARKIEHRTMGTRTMKTTTTTTKSTTARKPAEIVRNLSSGKTKTTKIEKPKENGVSTVVTEEISVVSMSGSGGDVAVIDSEPQLTKDISPVDENKLVMENMLILSNTTD